MGSRKEKKNDNAWYLKLLNLLKLETATGSGRINLAGMILLLAFSLIYSANDAIRHLISSVEDTIKSVALQADIYHPYESNSIFEALIPFLIGFAICLIFLYLNEKRKKDITDEE